MSEDDTPNFAQKLLDDMDLLETQAKERQKELLGKTIDLEQENQRLLEDLLKNSKNDASLLPLLMLMNTNKTKVKVDNKDEFYTLIELILTTYLKLKELEKRVVMEQTLNNQAIDLEKQKVLVESLQKQKEMHQHE